MSDTPVLGEIRNVAFSPTLAGFSNQFLPCDGRLLNISGNTALFAVIGTIYGGNGSSTFGLPDLSWKTAVPALVAPSALVQWTDMGPPATESHPSTVPRRFYRVVDITPFSP